MRPSSPEKPRELDHITYARFGIDPVEFYRGKFAGGGPGHHDYLTDPVNAFDIELARAAFFARELKGPNILDVGCGSAPYAATIRNAVRPERIVGVDLDAACVANARLVYDDAFVFSLGVPLPFPDEHFDSVFSCDVFGHIEFRDKDAVLREIARVTKRGGISAHVIESAFLDYDLVDPSNPDDPLLRYIHLEGHVGIETAQELQRRWSALFGDVRIENAMIYPFGTINTFLADPALPAALKSYFADLDPAARRAAHVALGHVASKLVAEFHRLDPARLVPDHTSPDPMRNRSGLVYLTAVKA